MRLVKRAIVACMVGVVAAMAWPLVCFALADLMCDHWMTRQFDRLWNWCGGFEGKD